MNLNLAEVRKIIAQALAEDIGTGDITTALTVPANSISHAEVIAKEEGIIAGLQVAVIVLDMVSDVYSDGAGKDVCFTPLKRDGDSVRTGDVVARIVGPTAVILTAERTLLNFMQRMSGIAAMAARMVTLTSHTQARIVDTRKTAPGLRLLDKYAVRAGGAQNHRYGLYDAVLIKDNHIQASGGITQAIEAAKAGAPHTIKIEVETDTLEQVREALDAGADMILLDNMGPDMLREAVAMCKGRALTEASGNVNEETVASVAETGVDLISIGALTHSVKAMDLSLDITE